MFPFWIIKSFTEGRQRSVVIWWKDGEGSHPRSSFNVLEMLREVRDFIKNVNGIYRSGMEE